MMRGRVRVLVVLANPRGTDSLRLMAVEQKIFEGFEQFRGRGKLLARVLPASTIHDVWDELRTGRYEVIHFWGNGTGHGLALEDERGEAQTVPYKALARLLDAHSPPLECAVLDASYTSGFGAEVSFAIPYVIRMRTAISDLAATKFARGFYGALAAGMDYESAFAAGKSEIALAGIPEASVPVLWSSPTQQLAEAAEGVAGGVVEGTVEVEGTGRYYEDGWGGRTREEAEREAREAAERLAREAAERELAQRYDDLVRSAFAELVQPGRLLFNPPDRMQLGQIERVEVRLTRTLKLDTELLRDLRGHGEPQVEEIPTAPLMAVTLKGDGFRITTYSDEEQSVTQDGITTWEFDIQALKRGQQRLVMCVSLRIPVPGQPLEHKSIPVREAVIDVQVGVPAVMQFVAGNWQWFIGTAIAIAAVLVAVLFH